MVEGNNEYDTVFAKNVNVGLIRDFALFRRLKIETSQYFSFLQIFWCELVKETVKEYAQFAKHTNQGLIKGLSISYLYNQLGINKGIKSQLGYFQ